MQVVVGDQPVAVAAGDADGDGDADLVVPVGPPGGIAVLRNDCQLQAACTGKPACAYCVGKPNSLGCTPQIAWSGTPSSSGADDFHVLAWNELSHQSGVALFGLAPAAIPFQGGRLCVHPPLIRTQVQDSGGTTGTVDCSGTYDFHVTQAWLAQHGWSAGQVLFAQYWSRDPQHPDGTGAAMSDGVRFVLTP
jgi:hypothetical protein